MTLIRNLFPGSRHSIPDLRSESSPARASTAPGRRVIVPSRRDGESNQYSDAPRIVTVCKIPDIEFSKLRVARAYIKLLCLPEGCVKMVSLARIGNYEVRMLDVSQKSSDAAALFSIELFDHDEQSSLGISICCGIEEGVAAFQDFISR
jgi:hypothetical protein